MSSTEGGIRMPRQPPAVSAPADTLMLYPALSIAGTASRPISVTTAPTMPVAVAKMAHVTMVATPSEPGTRAVARWRLRNRRSMSCARSTRYPMKRNSGIDQHVVRHDAVGALHEEVEHPRH